MPAYWSRWTLGPMHHVSPHPREFKGETFKEQINTTLGEHPGELVPRTSPRLKLELAHGQLAHQRVARSPEGSSPNSKQAACPEGSSLLGSLMVTDSFPRVCPYVSSSVADPPCLILLRALSTALITSRLDLNLRVPSPLDRHNGLTTVIPSIIQSAQNPARVGGRISR